MSFIPPSYTPSQIEAYFDHIDFPPAARDAYADPLDLLKAIQIRQISRVPFESLSLHYSKERLLSLDLQDLFEKIVIRGKGGYCMELNAFFAAILRGLGYKLTSAGGRVFHNGWTGLEHMVNFVAVGSNRYLVDVGFGSNGPMQPVLLNKDAPTEFDQITPIRGRMEYTNLAEHSDPSQRVWLYSCKFPGKDEWERECCYLDAELFPGDFEGMNLQPMKQPTSIFVQNCVAMRGFMDEEEQRIKGVIVMFGNMIRQNIGGEKEVLEELKSEKDRLRALEKWFKVTLTDKEIKGIKGTATELKG